ncbi:MAG: hypothetical protein JWO60_1400 [Frankiales bacterium]|nr:hypothetical protein [Frankiales bacterium]
MASDLLAWLVPALPSETAVVRPADGLDLAELSLARFTSAGSSTTVDGCPMLDEQDSHGAGVVVELVQHAVDAAPR